MPGAGCGPCGRGRGVPRAGPPGSGRNGRPPGFLGPPREGTDAPLHAQSAKGRLQEPGDAVLRVCPHQDEGVLALPHQHPHAQGEEVHRALQVAGREEDALLLAGGSGGGQGGHPGDVGLGDAQEGQGIPGEVGGSGEGQALEAPVESGQAFPVEPAALLDVAHDLRQALELPGMRRASGPEPPVRCRVQASMGQVTGPPSERRGGHSRSRWPSAAGDPLPAPHIGRRSRAPGSTGPRGP